MQTEQPSFASLGVAAQIADILSKKGITVPSPIQTQAIPIALKGDDVIGIAQTGTGKTFAFGLPMIERLARHKGRGLVLLPTRELALQVEENLRMIGAGLGMRTAVLIGGASMVNQKRDLAKKPHVIIATPGRLIDHLGQHSVNLKDVNILVLDEADRMLDMGFAPQIERILAAVPKVRQTMLFSATMPAEIVKIAAQHMRTPVRVEVAPQGTSAEKVVQEIIFIEKTRKTDLMGAVLASTEGSVLVFARTKHGARKLTQTIRNMGHAAAELHGNLSLNQRKASLEGFKNGKFRVLVATDIAARGVDVKNIVLVVNYDLPDNPEDYVHRIGRTGRAGREGKAISFVTPDQKRDVRDIERLIRKVLPMGKLPDNIAAPKPYAERAASSAPRSYGAGAGGARKPFARRPSGGSSSYSKPRTFAPKPAASSSDDTEGGSSTGQYSFRPSGRKPFGKYK